MDKLTVKQIVEKAFLKDRTFGIDGSGDTDKIFFYPDDPDAAVTFVQCEIMAEILFGLNKHLSLAIACGKGLSPKELEGLNGTICILIKELR